MIEIINIAHAGVISQAPTAAEVGLKILYFLLQLLGVVGIIALVVAGIMYFTAAGDQGKIERAKSMVVYIIVGLVVSLGAMIIVRQISSVLE